MLRRGLVLVLAGAIMPAAAAAQAPASSSRRAQPPVARQPATPAATPASPDDGVFAAAGKLSDAESAAWIEAADAVIAKTPADREAATRKMAAHLSAGRVLQALITYETWSKAAKREDPALVRRVALDVLRRLRTATPSELRMLALESLARGGDASSRQALVDRSKEASTSPDAWHAREALARLGDRPSIGILTTRARQGMGSQRLSALDALRGLPVTPETVVALREALGLDDPVLQGAAASLAGELGARDLVPTLKAVAASGRFGVPLQASCALVSLGDMSARAYVDESLASDLPDVKLLAAQALSAASIDGWQPALVPVLKDTNPINRLQAAAMLMPSHPDEATPIISGALADPNPVVREEAMKVIASRPGSTLSLFKRGLIDDAPGVRLRAAAAIEARTRP